MKLTTEQIIGAMVTRVKMATGEFLPSCFDALAQAQNIPFPVALALARNRRILEPIAQDAWKMTEELRKVGKMDEFATAMKTEIEVQLHLIGESACAGILGVTDRDLAGLDWMFEPEQPEPPANG